MSAYEVDKCLGLRSVRAGYAPSAEGTTSPLETLAEAASKAIRPVDSASTGGLQVSQGSPATIAPLPPGECPRDPPSQTSVPPTSSSLASKAGAAGPSAAAPAAPVERNNFIAHGFKWQDADVLQPIGGHVVRRTWSVRTLGGEIITEGGDCVGTRRTCSPLDYFAAVLPQDQLSGMVVLSSRRLAVKGAPTTTPGELLKLFVVILLSTHLQFGTRAKLWSSTPRTKHCPAPAFGSLTGMPRRRVDTLWLCLLFNQDSGAAHAPDT